mmetsp:Transcript_24850/g.73952  ORF Transcript_24850/g.73952 Transcript_24850/m.73952 type:complete len:233 (-) Transcript_24850:414-1112(-)
MERTNLVVWSPHTDVWAHRFLGMKSPTVPAYSGFSKKGMSETPLPVQAFSTTMKAKPIMARRACLISRSFISPNSSLLYLDVKVGPNHFGRAPLTGASTFQPRSPGFTPASYLLITFSYLQSSERVITARIWSQPTIGTWVAAFRGSAESVGKRVMKGSIFAPEICTVKPRTAIMHTRPCASSASRYQGSRRLFFAKPRGSKPTSPTYCSSKGLFFRPSGTGAQGSASELLA